MSMNFRTKLNNVLIATAIPLTAVSMSAQADIVQVEDVIITASLCVGQDCVNGEAFNFDTLRLKENNLRIKFQDTSNSSSFPTADWEITANDSQNGGANYLAFTDVTTGRQPFRVDANARSNALRVDAAGDVGLGVAAPVVELHMADGDTPTVRLEQNGSSGWTPQTWDVAGNETNFFIRDVTNGSQLPFKIKPGADDNTLVLNSDSSISIGRNGSLSGSSILIQKSGPAKIAFLNTTGPYGWKINTSVNGDMKFVYTTDPKLADGITVLTLGTDGTVTLDGDLVVNGTITENAR